MATIKPEKARVALRHGCVLMVTHSKAGPCYSVDQAGDVSAIFARKLIEASEGKPMPQGDLFMVANEDGLFPGFTQTWKAGG